MAIKYCTRCGRELSFRKSFGWEGTPVCKPCLVGLERGEPWYEVRQPITESQPHKSPLLAFGLAFFFGVIGMLYVQRFLYAAGILLLGVALWLMLSTLFRNANGVDGFFAFLYIAYRALVLPVWAYRSAA